MKPETQEFITRSDLYQVQDQEIVWRCLPVIKAMGRVKSIWVSMEMDAIGWNAVGRRGVDTVLSQIGNHPGDLERLEAIAHQGRAKWTHTVHTIWLSIYDGLVDEEGLSFLLRLLKYIH